MGLIFLILRFFYHLLPKKNSTENLIQAIKNDFVNSYVYAKKLSSINPKKIKSLIAIIAALIVLPMLQLPLEIFDVLEDILSAIMFFIFIIIFSPPRDIDNQDFPFEIFGFTYAVIFMFYSAGTLVFDTFYTHNLFQDDIWIYGYGVTLISYVSCIVTVSRFIERDLSREKIVLIGMIMVTTLEFITYYGVGSFSIIAQGTFQMHGINIFNHITNTINQGIFIASQSQILERTPVEIWGYIILNGTDVLTITAVLGFLMQKFMVK